jgi:hypothetical protein
LFLVLADDIRLLEENINNMKKTQKKKKLTEKRTVNRGQLTEDMIMKRQQISGQDHKFGIFNKLSKNWQIKKIDDSLKTKIAFTMKKMYVKFLL